MSRFANAFGPHRPEATYVAHAFPEHTFDTGEVSMNYAVAGSAETPALLLIPGQTESWWGYEQAMPLLPVVPDHGPLDARPGSSALRGHTRALGCDASQMSSNPRTLSMLGLLAVSALLAGCSSSHFETPEVQGPAAMVDDGGQPRLWVLSKQEEVRRVGVGGGGTRSSIRWRSDTFFHFDVQAVDPLAATPLWKKRLLTLGDPEAKGAAPSRA